VPYKVTFYLGYYLLNRKATGKGKGPGTCYSAAYMSRLKASNNVNVNSKYA